jgi:hypothetical protein
MSRSSRGAVGLAVLMLRAPAQPAPALAADAGRDATAAAAEENAADAR